MAETTVHGIEFQIKGNSKSAADALSKLAENLKALKQATSGGLGLGETVAQLKKLADSVSKIDANAVKNMKGLSSSLEKLSKVRLNPADISNLSKSVKRLGPVLEVFQKFGEIGRIGVIGSVAKQLTELQTVIDGMSEDTVKRLDEITRALERLKGIDFRGFTKAAQAAKKGVQTALATVSPKNAAMAMMQDNATDKEIADIFKAFGTGGKTATVEDAAKKFAGGSPFGALKIDLKECIKLLGEAAIKMIPFREQIAGAAREAGKLVREFAKDPIGNTMKGIGSILAAPLKNGTKRLKEYGSKLSGVIGGFKRIAVYRLMRTIIKEITQGFQEGTKNLYEWSTLVGGQFAKNMDDAATSMLYFKNSIGAAWSPLMNVLAPALRVVTDAAVDLLNIINQLLARLTGQTSWTRAKRVATEYGDAVAGAGQAAKEAMRYLAPFDELNVLPDDKDRGGGGGAANNLSEMFEEVATFDEGIADFADKVREAIQNSDWQGLGTLLGEKVNEIVDSLDWSAGGTKVGNGINAWFTTKYWTLETINFQNIGSKIAEFLNSALENINFNTIGRTLTQGFTNFGDFVIGAIENIDWGMVGSSIKDLITGSFDQMSEWAQSIDWSEFGANLYNDLKSFIEGLDFATIASSLFTLLGSAIGAAASMLSSFISGVVDDIWSYFLSFAQDANGDGEIAGKEIFNAILKGIKNAVTGIWTWIKTNVWEPFVSGFKKAAGVDSEDGEGAGLGKTLGTKILEGLASPFIKIKEWVQEHIIDPIKEKLKNFSIKDLLFGDGDDAESPTGNDGGGTFLSGWKVKVTDVEDEVPTEKKTLKDFFAKIFKTKDEVNPDEKNLEGFDAYVYDFTDYIDQRELENMMADVVTVKDEVPKAERKLNTFEAIIKTTKDEITDLKQKIINGVKAVFGSTDQSSLPAKEKTIDGMTAGFVNRVKTNGFKNTLGEMVAGFSNRVKTSGFNSTLGQMTAGFSNRVKTNGFKNTLGEMVAGFKDRVKSSGFNSTIGNMIANFTSKKSSLSLADVTWRTLANFVSKKNSLNTDDVTWRTTANFTNATKTSLTDEQKTWKTTANFTWWQNSLGDVWSYAKAWFNQYNGSDIQDWNNPWIWTYGLAYLNSSNTDYLDTPWITSVANITSISDNREWYDRQLQFEANIVGTNIDAITYGASGGVLKNGMWSKIPQYASGTARAHGSLFVAGEAGPEVVGHIGGRTEVLNRSQLAATMYSAVHAAMAGVRFNVGAMSVPISSADSYDEEAMYRAMLRALNDSDSNDRPIELDGDVLYRKMVQRNQMHTRMTGRNVMATA